MKKNYKYQELMNYFYKLEGNYIKLSFEEIEDIIGFELPESAYKYSAYWHPSKTHTICQSWIENGWKMIRVKLGEYLEFQKINVEAKNSKVQYKLEIYLSKDLIKRVIEEATKLGACRVGEYDHVASYYEIEGCWRPLGDSTPFTGKKNKVNYGTEYKLELRCEEKYVKPVIKKIGEIHPYEQAIINIIRLYNDLFD